ncbi:hypothetical protein [Methylosinus sp. Sm6]|uniref:hypothetical protein n=1 Tax=Methylosinus sp. Sm6 TaxID=2866948 RepID=UPI001C98FED1|nr:hypothetical protein [Methylosinus sp. Sm6]MBY6240459.1 hypothetical protein [Methylosinus sp. Sm6]
MIQAANFGEPRAAGAPELTPTEPLVLAAIACLQQATPAEIVRLCDDAEVSRSLRPRQPGELPDLERLEGEWLLQPAASEAALDAALGVGEDMMEPADDNDERSERKILEILRCGAGPQRGEKFRTSLVASIVMSGFSGKV